MISRMLTSPYRWSKNLLRKSTNGFVLLFATGGYISRATRERKADMAFYFVVFLVFLFMVLFFVWAGVTIMLMSGV